MYQQCINESTKISTKTYRRPIQDPPEPYRRPIRDRYTTSETGMSVSTNRMSFSDGCPIGFQLNSDRSPIIFSYTLYSPIWWKRQQTADHPQIYHVQILYEIIFKSLASIIFLNYFAAFPSLASLTFLTSLAPLTTSTTLTSLDAFTFLTSLTCLILMTSLTFRPLWAHWK